MVSFASRYRMPTSIRKDRPLTNDELQRIVPSAFSADRGSTPEPPKFPLPQFQPCNQCIQVHDFIATMKGEMPVQQNVLPGHR
ncbi:protein of unknown function DUF932 (plasmid) [Enterobacter soli]|uniref:hypothetical protein n=1 Tax=Enterobacter soli TaxID=885040 RepID=UPI000223D395|nr:hypothetical protein [Enterobacter soli]AEN67330.1 protein of unknown function DUF932 [Enterobacter soli]OAT35078.1 hypothetical protein M987_04531 [Enterobacter soli ATCC BAA-2102]